MDKLNSISFELSNSLYKGIENQKYYFVHTFAVDLNKDVDSFSSTTKYAEDTFASSMKFKNIFGVQFHPEKSSEQGLMVLKNFYNY